VNVLTADSGTVTGCGRNRERISDRSGEHDANAGANDQLTIRLVDSSGNTVTRSNETRRCL